MSAGLDKRSEQLLANLAKKLTKEGGDSLQSAIRQIGLEAVEQMVHNLSGVDVAWSGGAFRINVRTGNLRRHCRADWPFNGDAYSVFVYNTAEYAGQIEGGITGDNKRNNLLYGGSPPKTSNAGRKYKRIPGSGQGSLVRFWTVTEDSKLSNQPARPFVETTAEQMRSRAISLLGHAFMELLTP